MHPFVRCAAVLLVVALSGCVGEGATAEPGPTPTVSSPLTGHGPALPRATEPAVASSLSARQVAIAVAASRRAMRGQRATVTSATVTLSRGTVRQPNIGPPCTSGQLLHVTLIGTFPTIVVSGFFDQAKGGDDPSSMTVRAVLLTVDAETGHSCLLAVQTGSIEPRPGATVLHLG